MSVTAVVAVITLIVGGFGDSAGDFRPLLQIVVRAWLHVCFMVSIIGVLVTVLGVFRRLVDGCYTMVACGTGATWGCWLLSWHLIFKQNQFSCQSWNL